MSKVIFKTIAGSRLYGVETPESDYDIKGVFLESLPELLAKQKNVKQEKLENKETELFSLNYYMNLVGNGQVVPLDMLFAPPKFWVSASSEWDDIYDNRHKFVSRNISPFVGYAKQQAIKYGAKGSKLTTLKTALDLVESEYSFDMLCKSLSGLDGIEFSIETAPGGVNIKHIIICGKSFGETTDRKLWMGPLRKLLVSYGNRSRQATNGIDLKAQYHAVRICSEAIELLTTGNLTFPRPEADTLRYIRAGKFEKDELEVLVDGLFYRVKELEKTTSLQDTPDIALMEDLVFSLQSKYLLQTLAE